MNRSLRRFTLITVAGLVALTGCAREMSSNTYTSSSTAGKVLEGTVVSARPITIKDNEQLSDNMLGGAIGGVAGGVAGSAIGDGSGQALATVGGAIAGAVIGAAVQDKLSTSQGYEYVVRLDKKYIRKSDNVSRSHERIDVNRSSIKDNIQDSIDVEGTTTDLLSVIQGADTVFRPGQRVLIIYSDDRPRLAASN